MEISSQNTVAQTSPPPKAPLMKGSPGGSSKLAPSPTFRERGALRKDDQEGISGTAPAMASIPAEAPTTPRPRRSDSLARGLSLQLPPRWTGDTPASPFAIPLSPKLQTHDAYMQSPSHPSHSPITSLPRHSRGLDFSRACTTLHHSTLADQSSPDCSPIISHKAVAIPGRKMSVSSLALESPKLGALSGPAWGSLAAERSVLSSSVGSVNMLASDSESSESGDDASMGADDNEDPMLTTPQVRKLQNRNAPTPFNAPSTPRSGMALWGSASHFSPAQNSLVKTIRRTRLQRKGVKGSRKSSSSASGSGYSSMASPRATSPPPLRSIESATNGGYFAWPTAARSRRESLALGTDGLHISSGNDSGDEGSMTAPPTPGVVRRPVTRRGNLLPKTKGFARIRAALAEEAAPIDTEVRREAETIRQVRERENGPAEPDFSTDRPQTATSMSSPTLLPAVAETEQEGFGKDLEGETSENRGLGMSFATHANRNSGGMGYWNRLDVLTQTPPPPFVRQSSSAMSDTYMDSPATDSNTFWRRPRTRSSVSDASEAVLPSSNSAIPAGVSDDMHLKKFKRRREDDFDIATIKRRAVSPGVSAQNSPVLTHSPSQRDINGSWGLPPERKDTKDTPSLNNEVSASGSLSQPHTQPSRPGSVGSTMSIASSGTLGPGNMVNQGKKLGLQPMASTHDGLMKMSIE